MVSPILRLGYRPATFFFPPPTRRAGGEQRIWSTSCLACCLRPRRWHQLKYWPSSSIRPPSLKAPPPTFRTFYIENDFCKPMLPIRNSVQTYASNLGLARKTKPLENRASQCKPMLQTLQTYG